MLVINGNTLVVSRSLAEDLEGSVFSCQVGNLTGNAIFVSSLEGEH